LIAVGVRLFVFMGSVIGLAGEESLKDEDLEQDSDLI